MADALMIVIFAGFIAVCIAYTRWCDSIVGPDEAAPAPSSDGEKVA